VDPAEVANLLDANPGAFGLAETPPAVAEIVRGPAAPDEARILKTVLDETAALLAEQRVARHRAFGSSLAWLTVTASLALLGPTREAANAVVAARRLIDGTVAPAAAADTASELGSLLAGLGRWVEAAAAFDECLALHDRMLLDSVGRDRVVQTLAWFPTLARWTAYAHVRSGDPQRAVTTPLVATVHGVSSDQSGDGGTTVLPWLPELEGHPKCYRHRYLAILRQRSVSTDRQRSMSITVTCANPGRCLVCGVSTMPPPALLTLRN
jgi:hypothetical protein